jgi:DNA-binding GntR family transcriptional regulator
MSRAIGDPPL